MTATETTETPAMLRAAEVARLCGVTPKTVYAWLKMLPGFPSPLRIHPQCVRWRATDIQAFLAQRTSR